MSVEELEFHASQTYDDALARAAAENRIDTEYWDVFHNRHEVSREALKRILSALGWDLSSTESIDRDRLARFRREFTSIVPRTAVICETEKAVALTVPASAATNSMSFDIVLEDGNRVTGTLDLRQLPELRRVRISDEQWITYNLPLPAEIRLGYHTLTVAVNGLTAESHVIICPQHAYLPEELTAGGKFAGFNVTLYGIRSKRNWGCGDFTDLRELIDIAHTEMGFSFVGLNPLHALHNRIPYNTSPYLPLSIYYKNLIYIDVENVPEFKQSSCAQRLLASSAIQRKLCELRDSAFVAYTDVAELKRSFLKLLFRYFVRTRSHNPTRAEAFASYCEREGELLDKFALYCALDEVLHKQKRDCWIWRDWPVDYQHPDSDGSRAFAEQHPRLLEFYKYVQFVIDEQLTAAQEYAKTRGLPIGLYHDLALATDSCGSDLWAYRDYYVKGCRVGAPPDDFSPNGQDWAFPPPDCEAHRQDGYRLFRESIRKIVRHGGALRIDHVMRFFRLFWIPDGLTAVDGTYVRDYATDLMRVLALESVRSKNIIIGEDLGTVTHEIRDMLSRFGLLSYRLFYFEKHKDKSFKNSWEYPKQALVASSTHDLATISGFWTFRDIEARKAARLVDENSYRTQLDDRKREKQYMLDILHRENLLPHWYARNAEHVPEIDGDLHNAIVAFLSSVPSMLLLLNQEDLTKETEQQNLPGSTAEYPNWQRKMRASLEDLRSPASQPFTAMFRDRLIRTGRTSPSHCVA